MVYLFDLDGTLTDSEEGIVNAIKYALKELGIEEYKGSYNKFIGPPIKESLKKYFDLSEQKADLGTCLYRKYYKEKGKFENKPYDGIEELLKRLKTNNILAVATSKPEDHAIEILEHFGLAEYFEFIGGATIDGSRIEKIDVIKYTIEMLGLEYGTDIYMIGDRYTDILAANELGLTSVGVLWGFGSKEELENCEAKYICEDINSLASLLGEE